MSTAQLVAWTVRIMQMIQPVQVTPWAESYKTTADAFVDEAARLPLFPISERGIEKTLSVFLSVAWYEGRFDPHAKGDCRVKREGKCISPPQSLCTFQVGRSNLAGLGITEEQILSDIKVCVHAGRTMMKTSFRVCRARPFLELLGHYASGGNRCGGLKESRHRMNKAMWIFGKRNVEKTNGYTGN